MLFQARVPAKINLYLRVFGRRADGFHAMETVMLKVGFYDELSIDVGEGDGFDLRILGAPDLETRGNLIERACLLYLAEARERRGIRVVLEKNIFMGAGLGGGSADAAFALRLMDRAMGAVDPSRLMQIAASLGSDVPFFMVDESLAFATGRGEAIRPLSALPPRPIVLVNPGVHVSTKEAYAGLNRSPMIGAPDGIDPAFSPGWEGYFSKVPFENDFQSSLEARFPAIAQARQALGAAGASRSMMTGSGSCVFGIFEEEEAARAALAPLEKHGFRAVFARSL